MGKVLVMARRELAAYFFSPLAYVVGALFLATCGAVFFWGLPLLGIQRVFAPGSEASLRALFEAVAYLMIVVIPLLTMRLLSEEFRSGTVELLSTAPITETQIVLGKFFGVLACYVVLLATTAVFFALMLAFGRPDLGVVASGYVGLLLLGSAFLAVGIYAWPVTRYQLLAALMAIAILGGFGLLTAGLTLLAPPPLNFLGARLNMMRWFDEFSRGVIDTRGAVYFLSVAAGFLFLSVKTLESRRWR